MSVRLLSENILDDDDFISATEQAGPRIGQPTPAGANAGKLRLLSAAAADGSMSDWTHQGTATSDGSTTSIIDAKLSIYGDDFFIGAVIEFTGGENSSGSVTVTDFAGATGTLTWSGALNATKVGDTFTLTVPYATRSFAVALTGSGDVGDAMCKWSHNGATYLGRDNPYQADWENVEIVADNIKAGAYVATTYNPITAKLIVIYQDDDDANDAAKSITSNDRGVTWEDPVTITTGESGVPRSATCLPSGRILAAIYVGATSTDLYYSDDDGETWGLMKQAIATTATVFGIRALGDGMIGMVYQTSAYSFRFYRLYDNGEYYGTSVEIWADDYSYQGGDLTMSPNGWLWAVCSYRGEGDYKILARYSSDNGATWSLPNGGTTVMYAAGEDYYYPRILTDIDGSLLIAACNVDNDRLRLARTTDLGETWDSEVSIITDTTNDPRRFSWALINPEIFLITQGEGSAGANLVVNGNMEAGDPPSNWNDVGAPGADAETVVVHGGSQSLKWTDADDGEGSKSDTFTTTTNVRYHARIYYQATGSAIIRIRVRNGADTSYRWNKLYAGYGMGEWDLIEFYYTETSGGANAYIELLCVYNPGSIIFYFDDIEIIAAGGSLLQMRRGKWELYAAGVNDCPCAIWAQKQKLICDVSMVWQGYAGVLGDVWSFGPEYYFKMENILHDSPKLVWRSTQDDIDCSIVIDRGAVGAGVNRSILTAIAFFGCNVRSLRFQGNASDSWPNPSYDEHICFDLCAGLIDSMAGNRIRDDSLLPNYKDHILKDLYFRATSGTDEGETWQIKDNYYHDLYLELSAAATNLATDDAFAIFQGHCFKQFSSNIGSRYLRINIAPQKTAEGFYQIGFIPLGYSTALTSAWGIGHEQNRAYNTAIQQNADGDIVGAIQRTEPKYTFNLTWPNSDDSRREILALLDYCQAKNICLVPDDTGALDGSEDLSNTGFETAGGGGGDIFADWVESAGDGAIADETVNVHGGSHAAKLTAGATANTRIYQNITVTPGESRLLSFWTCVDAGDNSARYGVTDQTAGGKTIIPTTSIGITETSYAPAFAVFTVPDGCFSLRINLWSSATDGDVSYFDDVSCKPLGKVTACHLVKLLGDVQQRHRVMQDNFDLTLKFLEV